MKIKISVVFSLLGLLNGFGVNADSPALPSPYKEEVGNYVFVMQTYINKGERDRFFKEHEPFYKEKCGHSEILDKWDKNNCAEIDLVKRYSKSGLYHKDNPSKPLWTVDWYSFAVYVPADGVHLVRMGSWASSVNQSAVSFYKYGKLIARYEIIDLVDDKNKLRRSVSHFFWRSKVDFDVQKATLFIKTVDENEFTFDIKTGKIVKFNRALLATYHADITFKDGKKVSFDDFNTCSGFETVRFLRGEGQHKHVLYTSKYAQDKAPPGGESVSITPIPFEDIKSLRFVEEFRKDLAIWEIENNNGNLKRVVVDNSLVGLCGKSNGKVKRLSVLNIANLKIFVPNPSKQLTAIRTVEQRMRWQKIYWIKYWKGMCDTTNFDKYSSLIDKKKIMQLFTTGKCTTDSENILKALLKLSKWIRQQAVESNIFNFARSVAFMQGLFGGSNQSLLLYEYVLLNYELIARGNKLRKRYSEKALVQEILRINNLDNQIDKGDRYHKMIDEIENDIDGLRAKQYKKITDKWKNQLFEYYNFTKKVDIKSIKPNHDAPIFFSRSLKGICEKSERELRVKAIATLQRAVEIEEQLHPNGHFHTFDKVISLAICLYNTGDYSLLKNIYTKALAIDSSMHKNGKLNNEDIMMIVRSLNKLADISTWSNRSSDNDAIVLYTRILTLYKNLGYNDEVIYTLRRLAGLFINKKNYKKAADYYTQQVQIATTLSKSNNRRLMEHFEEDLEFLYHELRNEKDPYYRYILLGN